MTDERYKQIMIDVGMPNSASLLVHTKASSKRSCSRRERAKIKLLHKMKYHNFSNPKYGPDWGCLDH